MIVTSPFSTRDGFMNTGIGWMCADGAFAYISCNLIDSPSIPQDGELWPSQIEANDYAPIIAACVENGWQYEL